MISANAILDPVLRPILSLPPIISILVVSLVISLIVTFVYKLLTDQKKMKELRDNIKASQEELKRCKDNPKKMMDVQKKAMEHNMQYMVSSLKPTLITLLPIILIFGWLNANMAYYPLTSGEEFEVSAFFNEDIAGEVSLSSVPELEIDDTEQEIKNGKAIWILKGGEGEYILEFEHKNKTYQKDILISNERRYEQPIEPVRDSFINKIEIGNKPIIYIPLPFDLLMWKQGGIGWLGTYIIFSLVFSTGLRKLLKIH